jgi:3-hydroxyisobutyrate dehydrogenase-like beta-hydroxyacid dehydrogenase
MGDALARRLLAAGFEVVAFDIDREKREGLERLGGQSATSVLDVGRRCRRVLVAVLTIEQVEAVVKGDLQRAAREKQEPISALCVATCPPGRISVLAAEMAPRGVVLLDTPVSGTSRQVADGHGLGLLAGDPNAIQSASDVIGAVYPHHRYVGMAGDASKAKLAINLILGLHRLALAEGLVLAERFGLDLRAFLDVARNSAAYSQVMDVKGAKMVNGDYKPQGKIAQNLKDVHIILDEASRRMQDLPLANVLLDVLQQCVRHGQGELDNCAVIEEVRRRSSDPSFKI